MTSAVSWVLVLCILHESKLSLKSSGPPRGILRCGRGVPAQPPAASPHGSRSTSHAGCRGLCLAMLVLWDPVAPTFLKTFGCAESSTRLPPGHTEHCDRTAWLRIGSRLAARVRGEGGLGGE